MVIMNLGFLGFLQILKKCSEDSSDIKNEKIEHIGIAVKDIDYSSRLFSKILGKEVCKSENVDSEGVTTSIFQIGESKIELVAATNSESPIAKYLSKNKQGIHHLAILLKI